MPERAENDGDLEEGPITIASLEVDVEAADLVSCPGFHRVVLFASLFVPLPRAAP